MKTLKHMGLAAVFLAANVIYPVTSAVAGEQDSLIKNLATSTLTADAKFTREQVVIYWYYQEFLKRKPDTEGFNSWVGLIESRGCSTNTFKDIVWGFAHSQEFTNILNNLNDSARRITLVNRLFKAAVFRAPTSEEYVDAVSGLESGRYTEDSVIHSVINSQAFNLVISDICK